MNKLWIVLAALAPAIAALHAAKADEADFFRGKTLTVLIGSGPGGGVDQVSRAVLRHLSHWFDTIRRI